MTGRRIRALPACASVRCGSAALPAVASSATARRLLRCALRSGLVRFVLPCPTRIRLGLAGGVVEFLARELESVDGAAVLVVVVVAQAPDHFHARTLAEVLGRVLIFLAPPLPL